MSEGNTATNRFLAQFEQVSGRLGEAQPAWLNTLRRDALARFEAEGLPTRRHEDWKYTSLRPLEKQDFLPAPEAAPAADALARESAIPGLETVRLVLVNGRFSAELSNADDLPEGVHLSSIAGLMRDDPARLQRRLARATDFGFSSSFTALNTAFVEDGALLELDAGTVLERPIEVLCLSVRDSEAVVFHPRLLVFCDENSRAVLLEHHVGASGAANFNNAVTEIRLEKGARLDHYRLQRESRDGFHIASLYASQAGGSHYVNHNVNLGGLLVRNDINSRLEGEEASTLLAGLYLVDGQQHVDNHTCIDHAAPHTRSEEIYKGVLSDQGRAVFNGRVVVHKDAQKIDARQNNDNLLLSRKAEIDTKPELEIYADDVACSHGATVGQLDADALFYLRSRGIDEAKARDLLIFAFAESLIERMALAPVREWLEHLVIHRVSNEGRLEDLEEEGIG
jgi:Fe-S cluster assembly protein SufD